MTTEICVVHNLWIIQITIIPQTKSPIQNCLRGGFRERVGIIMTNTKPLGIPRGLTLFESALTNF